MGAFCLGHFFHPGTFLTALRQITARRGTSLQHDCTVMHLQYDIAYNEVKQQISELGLWVGWSSSDAPPNESVVLRVEKLFAQGFVVENGKLAEVTPHTPVYAECAPVRLAWVPKVLGLSLIV